MSKDLKNKSWSYSEYSLAQTCLQKYKHIVIDKLDSSADKSGDMAFGSALHAGVNATLNKEDGTAVFEMYWDTEKGKPLEYSRFGWEYLKDLGAKFIAKFTRMHAPKFNPLIMEQRLYASYNGLDFEGTPDFIGTYKDVLSLWDWKTSAYNYPKDKQEVALQLYLYAYLMRMSNNGITNQFPVTMGYLVFNKGLGTIQTLTWEFDLKRMYELLDNMKQVCDSVNVKQEYTKNPNACIQGQRICEFFERCWRNK